MVGEVYDQGQRARWEGAGRREELTQQYVLAGPGPTLQPPSWSVVLSPEPGVPETRRADLSLFFLVGSPAAP